MPIGTSSDIFNLLTNAGVGPGQARTTAGGIGGPFTPEQIEASRRHFEDMAQAGRQQGIKNVAIASALMLGGGALLGGGGAAGAGGGAGAAGGTAAGTGGAAGGAAAGGAGTAGGLSTIALPDIAAIAPTTVAAGGSTGAAAAGGALAPITMPDIASIAPTTVAEGGSTGASQGGGFLDLFKDFDPTQLIPSGGGGGGQQSPQQSPVVALQRDPLSIGPATPNNRAQILAQALRSQGELAGQAERDAQRIRERSMLAAMLNRTG